MEFTVKFRSDDVDIDVSWESEPQFDPLADHRFYTKDPRFGTELLFTFSLLRIYFILQSHSTSILAILYSTTPNNQFFVS